MSLILHDLDTPVKIKDAIKTARVVSEVLVTENDDQASLVILQRMGRAVRGVPFPRWSMGTSAGAVGEVVATPLF